MCFWDLLCVLTVLCSLIYYYVLTVNVFFHSTCHYIFNFSSVYLKLNLVLFSSCFIGFWDSELCCKKPVQDEPQKRVKQGVQKTSLKDVLRTRSPSQLDCSLSNGALCFINPLFQQAHSSDTDQTPAGALPQSSSPFKQGTKDTSPQSSDSVLRRTTSTEHGSRVKSTSRSPPPRPPPPLRVPRRPANPPRKQNSMPSTAVSWIKGSQEKSGLLGRLGSSFGSFSPSSSPPKKISSPIPTPTSRGKRPPNPPDAEVHRCHLALEDHTIEEAVSLSLAKLSLRNAALEDGGGSPAGRERLSDISISSTSSDSLDFTQSFSLPAAGTSPSRTGGRAGDSSPEEEEEEEEEDFGVSVESDQDISMEPPFKSKKRHSAGAFVLQRALKGHLRKVSGVFNSLMTPEKRAIRKILEQSRDKSTYFGCLVQDYVSFLQENRGCHTSGLDLLQTLRQFMTQMKSYLLQSSELDPPIESLIPEDQIGKGALLIVTCWVY